MLTGFKNAQILIVEDCARDGHRIASHLRRGGYPNIVQSCHGSAALVSVSRLLPDLIITDFYPTNTAGLELCREIRSHDRLSDTPVIVATSSTRPESRSEIFSAGATDLIFSPIYQGELLARVGIQLQNRRLISRLTDFQQQMEEELRFARTMQESLLPGAEDIEAFETVFPLKIDSHYRTSSGLGGDLWGMHMVSPSEIFMFIADFSGHGVSAALNTFRLHSYLASAREQTKDPGQWLEKMNRFLCNVLPVGQFATMFCGVIDFVAGSLCYASACSPPHLLRNDGAARKFLPIDGSGLPLGLSRDETYVNRQAPFGPGSTLFLFSDALIETPTPSDPVFTPQKLAAFLDDQPPGQPLELLRGNVLKRLSEEAGVVPADDLTLVVLRHDGDLT